MARMHSRAKGKSSSKKPVESKASWVRYKPKEMEIIIQRLGKEGKSAAQIGLIMRDVYGIPDIKKLTGKRISKILSDKGLLPELPDDLLALIRKSVKIRKHLEANHKDQPSIRGLTLTESKIFRLVKYYKRSGRLPSDWKYDPKQVKILAE
ncbi:30S ribosomal protein S15 [Candidatus Woesearchaeota archaeon]|nr:MAG: 30S ribosomal protein S15 [Candidatus Woesearchaeota archaeon]